MDTRDAGRFWSQQHDGGRWVTVVRRSGAAEADADRVLAAAGDADWGALFHAYGPGTDVAGLLRAVAVGDDATRAAAWWELWGSVHHQGTTYPASRPAAEVVVALATWPEHPDRPEAFRLLHALVSSTDQRVWRYADTAGSDARTVSLPGRLLGLAGGLARAVPVVGRVVPGDGTTPPPPAVDQPEAGPALQRALRKVLLEHEPELLGTWRQEPDPVRRAQLWLLTADREVADRWAGLVDAVLPARLRAAWPLAFRSAERLEESEYDVLVELEDWVGDGGGAGD